MKKRNVIRLLVCLIITYSVGFIGSILTAGNTNSEWFESIKPSITPPNYVFPIVWNVLFLLIALSLYFAWIKAKKTQKQGVAIAFGLNFLFNLLWTAFYFGLQNPLIALFDVLFLILSIVLMILVTKDISKKSAYLLIPYLLWVLFAAILNILSL